MREGKLFQAEFINSHVIFYCTNLLIGYIYGISV